MWTLAGAEGRPGEVAGRGLPSAGQEERPRGNQPSEALITDLSLQIVGKISVVQATHLTISITIIPKPLKGKLKQPQMGNSTQKAMLTSKRPATEENNRAFS